jgi:iron uptake system EfeUOB component EfeO/EfeM
MAHSEEAKAKMRKPRGEEFGAKISAALKGKPKSEEHKAKMDAALKRKAVVINGNYYESETFAATIEKVHRQTLRSRLKNLKPEWSEWRYATEEERENYLARDAQSP